MQKSLIVLVSVLISLFLSGNAKASEFCDGFNDAYKYVKGEYSLPPICPIPPITPIGSSAYEEGVKAGALRAKEGSESKYDSKTGNRYNIDRDGLGNTTVRGTNSRTGSRWTNEIDADGNQKGRDSKGRNWTYNAATQTYRRSDGKTCRHVGTNRESCFGGLSDRQQNYSSTPKTTQRSCDYIGGACYSGLGGPAYDGLGGPAYAGLGGPCYDGLGGPCYKGIGSDLSQCPAVCR